MKISLDWLKDYVDYQGSVEELDELFTQIGLNVDGIEQVGADCMIDLEVTSNRPDCLGHIGIAREVAAASGATFKMPEIDLVEEGKPAEEWTAVDIQAMDLSGRYTARIIDDVTVGESPEWMKRRLATVGIRSINNVVDITNYVMMEIGQPLHSFDYDKLQEGRIIVRTAQKGEVLEAIDHVKYKLDEKMLLIADAKFGVAIAGVMGGLSSEVSNNTSTILLESAHFDPLSVRRTSRALALGSDASFRFERDVDINMLEWASRRAAALLKELTGGKVAPGIVDAWTRQISPLTASMRMDRMKKLLGFEIDKNTVEGILDRLNFQPHFNPETNSFNCTVPSWRRGDVTREADLIEEVIRIHGYDKVPKDERIHITVKVPDAYQKTRKKVTTLLNGCGYFETVNVGFAEDKHWPLFAEKDFVPVRVNEFTRKSNNALRHSLLPSLLNVRKSNQDAGNGRCDIYELAAVHRPDANGIALENIHLAFCTDGDFQELRGVLETIISGLNKQIKLTCKPANLIWTDQGCGAELLLDRQNIGYAGQASQEVAMAFGLNEKVCMAQIDFNALMKRDGTTPRLQPISRFPAITRDLSLVLAEDVAWTNIEKSIESNHIDELCQLNYVGIYRGKGIDKGFKSLTLSMIFRKDNETLTHEQVDTFQEVIMADLKEKFNAVLRA
ncbi:MAG: phenylalanine--tRNA ligase subunit beta [Phycisphaerae bacterium]|nr:phenylalanine--tRNA ligase subunit beta [Phycisphaerae bacterium]